MSTNRETRLPVYGNIPLNLPIATRGIRKSNRSLRSHRHTANMPPTNASEDWQSQPKARPIFHPAIGLYNDPRSCPPQSKTAYIQNWLLQCAPAEVDLLNTTMGTSPPPEKGKKPLELPPEIARAKAEWQAADAKYRQGQKRLEIRGAPPSSSRPSVPPSSYSSLPTGSTIRSTGLRPPNQGDIQQPTRSAAYPPNSSARPPPTFPINPNSVDRINNVTEALAAANRGDHLAYDPTIPSHPTRFHPRYYPGRMLPADLSCRCRNCMELKERDAEFVCYGGLRGR